MQCHDEHQDLRDTKRQLTGTSEETKEHADEHNARDGLDADHAEDDGCAAPRGYCDGDRRTDAVREEA